MQDDVATGDGTDGGGRVRDVALDELRLRRQVLDQAGGEVVDHANRVAPRHECSRQMGPDESGAPGHQMDSHGNEFR